jgi:hypothetical protein
MNRTPLLLAISIAISGCSSTRSPETTLSTNEADRAFSEYVLGLRKSVEVSRAQLDSAVAQLDRELHSSAPSPQTVKRIAILDSMFRVRTADLLWAVRSANLSSANPATARAPFDIPPTPFLQPFADGEDWMLQSPMVFTAGKNNSLIVIVPRGFVTDYASIPRALRLLFPRNGDYGNAAIVHDYLYWRQDCTRAQSDNIMAIGMKEAGVPTATLRAVHVGVRLGGQGGWDNNRRNRNSGLIRTVGAPFDQVPPGATWSRYREWLRTHNGTAGVEYVVSPRVCGMGDSVTLWD